jgi:hypothetical protein
MDRMFSVACFILLAGTSAASAEPPQATETSKDVGFGFREVLRDVPNPPGAFEGIGHFRFLYYRDQQLSQFDTYSIAPSGRYAVFQDGPSGDIVLFVTKSRNLRVLQKYPGALVKRYTWEKGERTVVLEIGGRIAPIRASVE